MVLFGTSDGLFFLCSYEFTRMASPIASKNFGGLSFNGVCISKLTENSLKFVKYAFTSYNGST